MFKHESTPMLSLWFGNFFEPFYSDEAKTRDGIADAARMGFTSINLDSKPWEDFFARYAGEEASQYVGMHEVIMAEARKHGLDYTSLALYLCGDNLYPSIRDVPPVRGEEAVLPNGEPMGTYTYFSPAAQASMVEHVEGLLRLYGDGMRRSADGRIVMQTMFDPIPKPSFNDAGRAHYLSWLEARHGSIAEVNQRYGLSVETFDALTPEQYWLRPNELNWVGCALPTAEDLAERTPDFHRWLDNQTYLAQVGVDFFAAMKPHWDRLGIFAEPVLHQWGYFFNPPGQRDWQTGQRALDIFRIAPHVDGVLFIASPLNAENRPDAGVLGVEGAIARSANEGRDFMGGLYVGRHVNADIYATVPPGESIATLVAAGARRFHVYGYSGLDDGGVMFRLPEHVKESLAAGNRWAAQVVPVLEGVSRPKEVALLFPREMSLYEPLELDEGGRHRMDLLGWYRQFTDLGWHVDVVHPDQVLAGALDEYSVLVEPTNSLYDLGDNADLEAAVRRFVEAGGTLFHGPDSLLAERAFGITQDAEPFDCIGWAEEVIPHGWSTVAFTSEGTSLGNYLQSGRPGILQTDVGEGRVISFGFEYGYAYVRESMPIVPPNYGRREMHPIVLLERTPVEALIGTPEGLPIAPGRGIEIVRHDDGSLIVLNHRPTPLDVSTLPVGVHLVPSAPGFLAGHSACYLPAPSKIGARNA